MIKLIIIFFLAGVSLKPPMSSEGRQPFVSSGLIESLSVVTGWVYNLFTSHEHFSVVEKRKHYD